MLRRERPRVVLVVILPRLRLAHMRVYRRRVDIRMAEQLLNVQERCPVVMQVRGERMPECVRGHVLLELCGVRNVAKQLPYRVVGQY